MAEAPGTESQDNTSSPAETRSADNSSADPSSAGTSVGDKREQSAGSAPLSDRQVAGFTAVGLALLIIFVMFAVDDDSRQAVASAAGEMPVIDERAQPQPPAAEPVASTRAATAAPAPAAVSAGDVTGEGVIERKGEGRHFYTTIKIPAGAETLYLSGSGASRQEDGSMGSMERQVIDTFESFQETLEAEGWSMSDIVQVRAFAVADEFGLLDFDGFNRGYRRFFGTEDNPMKPVRSFVEIAGLVVPGWLVEIEIRAARLPE